MNSFGVVIVFVWQPKRSAKELSYLVRHLAHTLPQTTFVQKRIAQQMVIVPGATSQHKQLKKVTIATKKEDA